MKALLAASLVTLLAVTSCGSSSINKTLKDVESYMDDRPGEACEVLDSLSRKHFSGRKRNARFALLYSMALDKNYVDVTDDSLMNVAMKWYSRHGSAGDKAKAYYYLGRVQQNAGSNVHAAYNFLTAESYSEAAGDSFYTGMIATAMSIISNNTYSMEESLSYSDKAIKSFSEASRPEYENISRLYRGIALSNLRKHDEAALTLDSARAFFEENKYAHMSAETMSVIAYNEMDRDEPNYAFAADVYGKIMKHFPSAMTFSDYCYYLEALYFNGSHEQAWELTSKLTPDESSSDDMGRYYSLKYKILKDEGRFEEALQYMELYTLIQDDIYDNAMEQSLIKAQRNYHEDEAKWRDNRIKVQRLVVILSITIFILILVILYIVVQRQKTKREMQRITMLEAISYYKTRTESIENELSVVREGLKRAYRSRFTTIAALYEKSMAAGKRTDGDEILLKKAEEEVEKFRKEMRSRTALESKIDKEIGGIMTKLREDFPKMKEVDIELIMYQIIGLDTMMIAMLLDMEPNYVHSRRHRIKNKIMESDSPNRELYLDIIF